MPLDHHAENRGRFQGDSPETYHTVLVVHVFSA
jgi:hypothetical protein